MSRFSLTDKVNKRLSISLPDMPRKKPVKLGTPVHASSNSCNGTDKKKSRRKLATNDSLMDKSTRITDFFPVRRSCRRPESELKVSHIMANCFDCIASTFFVRTDGKGTKPVERGLIRSRRRTKGRCFRLFRTCNHSLVKLVISQ